MAEHKRQLATDSVVVSEPIWVRAHRPACPAGLRGLAGFELVLKTGETDQHSGTTGGAARNPMGELNAARLGNVRRGAPRQGEDQGFLRRCRSAVEARAGRIPFLPRFFREEIQRAITFSSRSARKDPMEVMKRIWATPTMEVHGVVGATADQESKTIIPPYGAVKGVLPARSEAGSEENSSTDPQVRPGAQSRTSSYRRGRHAAYKRPSPVPLADAVERRDEVRIRSEPVFVTLRWIDRRVISMERYPQMSGHVPRPLRCRNTAITRRTRTSTGSRRAAAWSRSRSTSRKCSTLSEAHHAGRGDLRDRSHGPGRFVAESHLARPNAHRNRAHEKNIWFSSC